MKNAILDKIRGNFLGVAIGDSLGKPVEMLTPERISMEFGRITDYHDCSSHKYFADDPKGTTTDDWQLTKAVARAMITTGKFDLDEIASEHCKEFIISVRGWGGSTREAISRIVDGVPWKEASKTDKENRGLGNGICMKASPIGLYMALTNPENNDAIFQENLKNISDMATMTHRTSIGVTSGLVHAFGTMACFKLQPQKFIASDFLRIIIGVTEVGRQFYPETLKDDLKTRFEKLRNPYSPDQIIDPGEFGGGTCYVYDSLPFTYAWFLRNPHSIETLYDCVNAGGDADTNCSMLGGLLGALHGTSIFPKHLIDGLKNKDEVFDIADQFYKKFGNEI